MRTSLVRNSLLLAILACLYAASYHTLLGYRADHAVSAHRPNKWNLPPLVLKTLAGEFKGLVADLIVLEAGARLGTEVIRNPQGGYRTIKKVYDWPTIHQLFVASQALDPAFAQTYTLAQGWLPWEPANMVTETQDILKIAAKNRPWDWRPTHDLGFNEYYFRNNPGTAGKLFLEAAKTPNAPAFLTILGARLAQKGGETESALIIMKSMLAAKDKEEPGYADMLDRLHALEGVLVIEKAVINFEKTIGRKPASLSELTSTSTLAVLPPNPYKLNYCIDTAGIVYFDKPDCRHLVPGGLKR